MGLIMFCVHIINVIKSVHPLMQTLNRTLSRSIPAHVRLCHPTAITEKNPIMIYKKAPFLTIFIEHLECIIQTRTNQRASLIIAANKNTTTNEYAACGTNPLNNKQNEERHKTCCSELIDPTLDGDHLPSVDPFRN